MCDNKQALRDVFNAFDADKSGQIDAKELQAVMRAYFESVGETADDKRVADAAAVSSLDSSGVARNVNWGSLPVPSLFLSLSTFLSLFISPFSLRSKTSKIHIRGLA